MILVHRFRFVTGHGRGRRRGRGARHVATARAVDRACDDDRGCWLIVHEIDLDGGWARRVAERGVAGQTRLRQWHAGKREVQIGRLTIVGQVITEGLQGGEWVVTRGVNSLRENQQVKILQEAAG